MRTARLLIILLALMFLIGCVEQDAELIHLQTEQGLGGSSDPNATQAATLEPTPTPEPVVVQLPEATGVAFPNDALGIPIIDAATHYADYYVRYYQIRIYEVEDSTFADLVADNSFSAPLQGAAKIVFTGTDGKEYGYGELYTADGALTLNVGRNYLYAEILTEVDVQMMDFAIVVTTPFLPVMTEN